MPSQILIGVIADALTALGEGALRRSRQSGFDLAISDAVSKLTEVEEISAELGGERLRAFLESPEMAQFGRQVFAIQIDTRVSVHGREACSLTDLQRAFVNSLQQWTGLEGEMADLHGERLFRAFVDRCDEALSHLAQRGYVDAADARSAMNTKRVIEELTNLKYLVQLQEHPPLPDLDAILQFASLYRRQAVATHTEVALPSLETHHTRHVNDIYVKPSLVTRYSSSSLRYDALLPLEGNTVILGDPGSGKSTLISKLVADVASTEDPARNVPIVVVLRDYAAEKTRSSCSILDFLTLRAGTKYQLPDVPPNAFEYLLRNRRAIVFFDGLDELLEIGDRREIVSDVEAFRRLYPTVSTVVTSRVVGYEEAPLHNDEYRHLVLAPLDEPQVEEYARLALATHPSAEPAEQVALREAFMERSASLADLRGNPLLLGLLLERYVKTRDLPAHRVHVIESCALMLFERWDTDRKIPVRFPFESKLKPAVAHIAFDIYSDVGLQQGVAESWLVARTRDYLIGRKYRDADEANAEAQEFISLCRGRTWVFSAIGATASGTELYAFTHRTFMEYFVAVYLFRDSETASDLADKLQPWIESQEWDEVCQIAIYLGANREQEPDTLLGLLSPTADTVEETRGRNRLTFCTRALTMLVPDRLETVDEFLEIWMPAIVSDGASEAVPTLVSSLVNSHPENQVTLSRALPGIFVSEFGKWSRPESMTWVLELGVNLTQFLSEHASEASYETWFTAEQQIAMDSSTLIRGLAETRLAFAQIGLLHQILDVETYLGNQGAGTLFVARKLPLNGLPGARELSMPSLAEEILEAATWAEPRGEMRKSRQSLALSHLTEFGRWAVNRIPAHGRPKTRWSLPPSGEVRRPNVLKWLAEPERGASVAEWTANQLFGAICLALALSERSKIDPLEFDTEPKGRKDPSLIDLIQQLLFCRNSGMDYSPAPAAAPLSVVQQQMLQRWARREFSFTR